MDAMVILGSVVAFVVGAALFAMGFQGGFTWWQAFAGLVLMAGSIVGDAAYVRLVKK